VWKLPVLFFLENNLYGMGSHIDRVHAGGRDIYISAENYNIPAVQVDGMDIMAVREATAEAVKRVRSGSGPVMIEAKTYRFRGHSMADPTLYRESEEVDEWRLKDPIERFKQLAAEENLVTEDELSAVDKQVEAAIAEAVKFAEESPDPDFDSIFTNIYA
jgi:pyruvate dehydrogenase E1 component alpha subunit